MTELAWTDQLSVGNARIDSGHINLINMVDSVVNTIRSRESSALSQALNMLEYRLRIHFADEERIAQAINFPFAQHKQAQKYALKELQHLKDELASKDGYWSESAVEHYANFLKNWIIDQHIIKSDMQMKPALQKHPYEFLSN